MLVGRVFKVSYIIRITIYMGAVHVDLDKMFTTSELAQTAFRYI